MLQKRRSGDEIVALFAKQAPAPVLGTAARLLEGVEVALGRQHSSISPSWALKGVDTLIRKCLNTTPIATRHGADQVEIRNVLLELLCAH